MSYETAQAPSRLGGSAGMSPCAPSNPSVMQGVIDHNGSNLQRLLRLRDNVRGIRNKTFGARPEPGDENVKAEAPQGNLKTLQLQSEATAYLLNQIEEVVEQLATL